MSFFVFLESDAIDKKFNRSASRVRDGREDQGDARKSVRRPYRGIQIKEDTYSTLSVIDSRGLPVPLISESAVEGSGRGAVNDYADFIIQHIDDQRVEKQSIIETFGDSFIFFFGERPRMVTFSGVLVNTEDFNWVSQFLYNYEHYLRGSKLVQRNARAFLAYDSMVVEGYPINVQASRDQAEPHLVPFQMTMFVTNFSDFANIGSTAFPLPPQILGLDAANQKLTDSRDYISTTAAVRRENLSASGAGGLRAALREAGRSVNNVLDGIDAGLSNVKTLLSGRVVRVPIGVAGFLQQVGEAAVGIQAVASANATQDSGRLVLPGGAKFAAVNDTQLRTRISENIDEYPLFLQTETAFLPPDAVAARNAHNAEIEALYQKRATELAAVNLAAEGQASALGAISDIIQFTKKGFALYNNARALVGDPAAVLLNAVGLSGIGRGLPSSAQTKQDAARKMLSGGSLSSLTNVPQTALVNSSIGKQIAGRALGIPTQPTIPNPSITGKPNTR